MCDDFLRNCAVSAGVLLTVDYNGCDNKDVGCCLEFRAC